MRLLLVVMTQVVVPGDVVQQLPPSGAVRIGPGLRAADGAVLAQKAGVLRQTRAGKLWLEGHQRRCGGLFCRC
jgi:exosome complex RNA-binding protein Rrp4